VQRIKQGTDIMCNV